MYYVIFKRSHDIYTIAINRVGFVHGAVENCNLGEEKIVVIFYRFTK